MPTRLKEKLGQGHRIQVLSGPGGCVGGHIPQEEEMSAPQLCTYTWDQESWEGPESSGICTRQKRDLTYRFLELGWVQLLNKKNKQPGSGVTCL